MICAHCHEREADPKNMWVRDVLYTSEYDPSLLNRYITYSLCEECNRKQKLDILIQEAEESQCPE